MRVTIVMIAVMSLFTLFSGCAHNRYDLKMVPIASDNWGAVKYDATTGEAWRVSKGKWLKIEDTEEIPKSKYIIKMVPLDNNWGAIRIDVTSGLSWRTKKGKWIKMGETFAR